jgi:hypothetical protein
MPKAPKPKLTPKAMSAKPIGGGMKPAGTGRKAAARSVIRKQTRKAVRHGMPVKPSNKGLGITKNEGGPKLQKAIKTLGYKKAEKVTQRTKSRTIAKEAGKIGAAMKPRPASKKGPTTVGKPGGPRPLGFKPGR